MTTKKASRLRDGDYICRDGRFPVRVLATEKEKSPMGDRVTVYFGGGILRYWHDDLVEVSDDPPTS